MKSILSTLLISLSLNSVSNAQSDTLYKVNQDFESTFKLSTKSCLKEACAVEVLPNWFANEVRETARVYPELKSPLVDKSSLGLIPIADFNPEISYHSTIINQTIDSIQLDVKTKSLKNGGSTDLRSSILYFSYSTDNGITFSPDLVIDTFKNENGTDKTIFLVLQDKIIVGSSPLHLIIKATRANDFAGTAAKIILDNLQFSIYAKKNTTTAVEQSISSSKLNILSQDNHTIWLNKTCSGQLISCQGKQLQALEETSRIDISNLQPGIHLLKTTDLEVIKFVKE